MGHGNGINVSASCVEIFSYAFTSYSGLIVALHKCTAGPQVLDS